ncbi:MAG: hypothetical protein ACR2QI_03850 [Woeseiaceae bacterium]
MGEFLDAIQALGLKDNTIFIFTSDNGREGVTRSFGFTGPWRSGLISSDSIDNADIAPSAVSAQRRLNKPHFESPGCRRIGGSPLRSEVAVEQ